MINVYLFNDVKSVQNCFYLDNVISALLIFDPSLELVSKNNAL